MCTSKRDNTYVPEPPFPHLDMVRVGRLVVVPACDHPAFAAALQRPSVIFATHPSLRCGDAVHLVRVLGPNPKHTLIGTGP
jgi:integrator complex subunit 9